MNTLYLVRNQIEWNWLMLQLKNKGTRWLYRNNYEAGLDSIEYSRFIKGVVVFPNNTAIWKHHVSQKKYDNCQKIRVRDLMKEASNDKEN